MTSSSIFESSTHGTQNRNVGARFETSGSRNVQVSSTPYNAGYSISVIGGYDSEHTVEDVILDNFRVDGVKVTNPDTLDLFTKQVKNIEFR